MEPIKDEYVDHLESTSNYLNDDELSQDTDDKEFEEALEELDYE